MPLIRESEFKPTPFLSNRHFQTLWANVLRNRQGISYQRERLETNDGDFLLLDWSCREAGELVILSHGLEGHSRRPYMLGMVKALNDAGFDALAWNFRGCGGEINRRPEFYYAGATYDLDQVIQYAQNQKRYSRIHLLGFSLGGNKTLKWLGEQGQSAEGRIHKAVAISVPINISDSVERLTRDRESFLYMKWFLTEFKQKLKRKEKALPGSFDLEPLSSLRTIRDFDERYTAPVHGFSSAAEMYRLSSSIHVLSEIRIPTLLINAKDDPFLGPSCFPVTQAEENPHFYLEMPDTGGHVGFFKGPMAGYWAEKRVVDWLKSN